MPNFQLVPGYRHTLCVSVDDDVVHGIPSDRPFRAGDIVSVDGGAELDGWNGDAAFTVVLPDPARPEVVASRVSALDGDRVGAVARHRRPRRRPPPQRGGRRDRGRTSARAGEYGILTDYVGHGIGRTMHEEPPVFNYRVDRRGPAVKPGLVVAIEPMVVAGAVDTFVRDDEWTVTTADGADSAHWEHSVAVHARRDLGAHRRGRRSGRARAVRRGPRADRLAKPGTAGDAGAVRRRAVP